MQNHLKYKLSEVFNNQSGQGLTEYMILLVLVVICSIAVVEKFGKNIDSKMSQAAKEIGALNVNRGTNRD